MSAFCFGSNQQFTHPALSDKGTAVTPKEFSLAVCPETAQGCFVFSTLLLVSQIHIDPPSHRARQVNVDSVAVLVSRCVETRRGLIKDPTVRCFAGSANSNRGSSGSRRAQAGRLTRL
jgi:hypothetical protein